MNKTFKIINNRSGCSTESCISIKAKDNKIIIKTIRGRMIGVPSLLKVIETIKHELEEYNIVDPRHIYKGPNAIIETSLNHVLDQTIYVPGLLDLLKMVSDSVDAFSDENIIVEQLD